MLKNLTISALTTLIGRLKEGRYVIPDFQREFEWKPWDIRELMRSIFLDYYIGSLLLWKGKPENFHALSCEAIYGYVGNGRRESIVLDGQQRLTAMYYAFLAPDLPLPTRSNRYFYFVRVDRFMDEKYDEAFEYDWSRGWAKVMSDPKVQYGGHIFPLSIVGQSGWALPNWVQGYQRHWEDAAGAAKAANDQSALKLAERCVENAMAFGEHLKGITEQYQMRTSNSTKNSKLTRYATFSRK